MKDELDLMSDDERRQSGDTASNIHNNVIFQSYQSADLITLRFLNPIPAPSLHQKWRALILNKSLIRHRWVNRSWSSTQSCSFANLLYGRTTAVTYAVAYYVIVYV